jgi:pimeloyl-ACP methyl ester carboxylesterase
VRRVRRGFTLTPEVADRFDIVGFDPRGVGESTPITCGPSIDAFRTIDHAPTTVAGQLALEAAAKAVADECASTEGVRLPHLGTYEVVRDVEELRLALGEPRLSFVGISYGTLIGLLWAEAYPTSVRAMVLDGVADPNEGGSGTAPDQLRAVDRTFTDIADACSKDPACPTTADGGVISAYDQLAQRIAAAGGALHGVGLTQLRYAVFRATYGSEEWPGLWRALHDGMRGDLSGIADLARSFTGLTAYAPFAIVTCLDSAHPEGPAPWRREARAAAKISPRFGAALSNELLPCAYLPTGRMQPHVVTAPGTPPLLVVGSTGDVATPYDQAVHVAERLANGVLLTVDLQGHVAIGASACAEEAMARYLVDGTAPASGTRC